MSHDPRPDAAQPPKKPPPSVAQAAAEVLTNAPDLVRMIRYDGTIYAHEFCRVCGIKPNTLRMSRLRGKGPPAQRVSNNRVVISLRDAAIWLQRTGRYGAAICLAEWLDRQWRKAEHQHRKGELYAIHF